jgi:hypothetical protein
VRPKLNGAHTLLVYVDDVNLLVDNIDIIKKNTERLIEASKEVDLEVNTEKTKCTHILLPLHQNAGQVANRFLESVAQFIYLVMTVTNQFLIQEEIKIRLNLSNACYSSFLNFVFLSAVLKHKYYSQIRLTVKLQHLFPIFLGYH